MSLFIFPRIRSRFRLCLFAIRRSFACGEGALATTAAAAAAAAAVRCSFPLIISVLSVVVMVCLLVVLLVLCDTRSVPALLLV